MIWGYPYFRKHPNFGWWFFKHFFFEVSTPPKFWGRFEANLTQYCFKGVESTDQNWFNTCWWKKSARNQLMVGESTIMYVFLLHLRWLAGFLNHQQYQLCMDDLVFGCLVWWLTFFWLWGPVGFGVWLLVFMVATWIWIRSVQTWQWPCNKWASLWLEQAEYEREAQSPEYALIFLGGYMDGVHEALLTVWRLKHGHDVFRRDWQLDFVMVSRYEEGIKGSCLVQRRQGLRYLCDSDWWGSFKGVTSVKVMLRCEDMMPNPEASKN